jgi:outer membrane protein assembly factor BamB
MRRLFFVVLASCMLGLPLSARADDWLQFRGQGFGRSQDKGLPVAWSADSNIAWKTPMPGAGTSSPIVVGNRIFLTCYSGYGLNKDEPGEIDKLKLHILCLDRAGGKILWSREVPVLLPETPYKGFNALHGYASSTPVSDGKSLYVFFGKSGVFAFDLDGEKLWHVGLGKNKHGWGSATSPLLYDDLLIVNASVESGALYALDKKTGKEVWKAKDISSSWSSPVLVDVKGKGTELVVSGSKKILAFDPKTGKEIWHADSFNWYVCPTVVAHDGVIYALQNSTCVAVKAGGAEDVTKTHTLWQTKFGSTVTSPVYHEGHVYWPGNPVYCLNAKDGEAVYKERLKPGPDQFYGSPTVADGKIYCVSRTKGVFVLEASPKFKLLAHNTLDLDTSVFNASPVVSNSQLLLRSDRFLYCIGKER